MILFGSTDPGAIRYFKSIYKELSLKVIFAANEQNKNFIIQNKLPYTISWKTKDKVKLVITGSSLGDTLDKEMITWSKKNNIYSISIIEHWTNFSQRFNYKKKKIYPNLIFVNDLIARNECLKSGLNPKKINVLGNPLLEIFYHKYTKKRFNKKIKKRKNKIIFLSQPTQEHLIKQKNTLSIEKKIIILLQSILPESYSLTVKLHPRESDNKFEDINTSQKKFSTIRNLSAKKIATDYNFIIGISTFLLFELAYLRDDLISFKPKSNKFIGQKLGIVKNVSSKKILERILLGKISVKSNTKIFKSKFVGSKEKIVSFINHINHL